MTNNTEQYRCNRCTMTFRIGEAIRCDAERTRCAEPGCGLRFSHAMDENGWVKLYLKGSVPSGGISDAKI
jgi:predicted nucleic acid-binding Zn ribbon protein